MIAVSVRVWYFVISCGLAKSVSSSTKGLKGTRRGSWTDDQEKITYLITGQSNQVEFVRLLPDSISLKSIDVFGLQGALKQEKIHHQRQCRYMITATITRELQQGSTTPTTPRS